MKKIIAIIIMGIILVTLMVCGADESKGGKITNDESNIGKINIDDLEYSETYKKRNIKEKKVKDKYSPIVIIEELPINVEILEPDSVGKRYMKATYENNSKYTIKGLSVTVILDNKNEKIYLFSYDTVLRGGKSPGFETFIPESAKIEDWEILKYEITVEKKKDTKVHIIYDVKTKEYNWF